MKKALLFLLVAAQLAAMACADGGVVSDDTSASGGSVQDETTEEVISDNLPEKDYGGETFTMFIRNVDEYITDMYAESENGDIVNDAVYERNRAVEERFGVTIEMVRSANVYANDAKSVIVAGEDAYDILVCHGRTTATYAHNQLLREWNTELPYIDLDQPWWNQDARESLSISGKLYTCSGDICHLNLGNTFAMYYNK